MLPAIVQALTLCSTLESQWGRSPTQQQLADMLAANFGWADEDCETIAAAVLA